MTSSTLRSCAALALPLGREIAAGQVAGAARRCRSAENRIVRTIAHRNLTAI